MSVWEKFDPEEYKGTPAEAGAESSSFSNGAESEPKTSRWNKARERSFWAALNIAATIFWIYVLLKLFVGDFDRWIVSRVSPSLLWILDYRFFFILTIVTVVFLFARGWRTAVILPYILFFPVVVMIWKIPRFYYRSRSWNFVVGTVQVLWSLGKSIKFTLVAVTAFALATLVIELDGPDRLRWVAVATLLVLWVALLIRAVAYAIGPSKFVVHQQKILGFILGNDIIFSNFAALPSDVKGAEVTHLRKAQIDQLVTKASMGLSLYAGCAIWAEKLDQYRKSGTSVAFSAFAVVALVAQALVIFAIVNLGIYHIDGSEFAYTKEPNFVTFVRYAFASMYSGEIEAIRPVGTAASWVNVGETFSCGIIVLVFIVSLIFSVKQMRDDHVAEESIQAMRRKADAFADKLAGEYSLPLADLLDRVVELGGIFASWIRKSADIAVLVYRHAGTRDQRS